MNLQKFFEMAKEAGIEQSQLYVSNSRSFRIQLFHHEVDTYTIAENHTITATGIYQGKFATASAQIADEKTFQFLIESMIESAKFTEKPAEVDLFPGSEKYRKGIVFNKRLGLIPAAEKLAMLHRFEDAIYAADPRVCDADNVVYSEGSSESILINSFGLKLHSKRNYYCFVAGAVLKQGEETKTFYDVFYDNDFSKFNPEALAESIVRRAASKFGGAPCPAKKYPTVIHRDIMSSLLGVLLSACSADEVQRKSSFLIDKIGQKIASSKLTVVEDPYKRTMRFYYFDDEGVAATKKTIIKNGVLELYLHNRQTAKKAGTVSTGNAVLSGSRMKVGADNVFVKPGKKSFDEMIAGIEDGVYITEVAGLGTGLNSNSGDFSCQAEGYRIRNGKIAEPLNLITLSGNILKMFKDLVCFDNNLRMDSDGVSIADAFIRKMSIGGL